MYSHVQFTFWAANPRQIERNWRKLVGVEPTCDTKYRTTGLKPAPGTGQD